MNLFPLEKLMIKGLLCLYLIISTFKTWSQNVYFIQPAQNLNIEVCEETLELDYGYLNPSVNLSYDSLIVNINSFQGLKIDSVSISNGTGTVISSSISNTKLYFNHLYTQDSINFKIYLSSNCEILDFISGGGDAKLKFSLSYDDSVNNRFSQVNESNTINPLEANLNFTSYVYQSKLGFVGETYTRCFTVQNVGDGSTSRFIFKDDKGSSISIDSVTIGIGGAAIPFLTNGNIVTIELDSTLLPNGKLDVNEQIQICETITIDDCIDVGCDISVNWGCDNLVCQTALTTANTVFEDLSPKIEITPWSKVRTCYGPGFKDTMAMEISNNGNGDAFDIEITVSQGYWTSFRRDFYSAIDSGSIELVDQMGGTRPIPFSLDTTYKNWNSRFWDCLPDDGKARFVITIPEIKKDSSYFLRWTVEKCCLDDCSDVYITRGWRMHMLGWNYDAIYYNQCENEFNIPTQYNNTKYDYTRFGEFQNTTSIQYNRDPVANEAPAINGVDSCNKTTVKNAEPVEVNFYVTTSEIFIPRDTSDYFEFEFILPPCLDYQPKAPNNFGVKFLFLDALTPLRPDRITISGDTVRAFFENLPHDASDQPIYSRFDKAKITIETIVNCATCSFQDDTANVQLKFYLIPDKNCGCRMLQGCIEQPLIFNCDANCQQDFAFSDYCIFRENVGLPDINDDGEPDPASPGWTDNIRRDRLMVGDTIYSIMEGTVPFDSVLISQFNYLYSKTTFADVGNYIEYLDADIQISEFLGATYVADNITLPVVQAYPNATDRIFYVELDINNLNGINFTPPLPPNFKIEGFDQISIRPRFYVDSNLGNGFRSTKITANYYATSIQDTGASISECDGFNANLNLVGYYLYQWNPNSFKFHSCDEILISQNFYLSIGNCCNNYSGGNMFPYEYRHWATPDTFILETKYPYDLSEVSMLYYRTSYRLDDNNDGNFDIRDNCGWRIFTPTPTPELQSNGKYHYKVDMKNFIDNNICLYSDDGYNGTIRFRISPNCLVKDEPDTVNYLMTHIRNQQLFGTECYPQSQPGDTSSTSNIHSDVIDYDPPNFFMQSLLPNIQTEDSVVEWEVLITNIANESVANNVWFANASPFSSIRIKEIQNLNSGNYLTLSGNIFELDG